MDVTLDRILSLLPRNEAGKIQHGARAEFAKSIGLKSGNVISDWVNGRSRSYEDYVYQIASKYNVSPEWLRGETDEKRPQQGVSAADQAVLDFVHSLPPEKLRPFLQLLGAPEELLAALDREARQG